jgi:hypothetical protein
MKGISEMGTPGERDRNYAVVQCACSIGKTEIEPSGRMQEKRGYLMADCGHRKRGIAVLHTIA